MTFLPIKSIIYLTLCFVRFFMNKVKIITDSTNDLGFDILKELDIEQIPLFVNFGEES